MANEHQLIIDQYDGTVSVVNSLYKLIDNRYSDLFFAVIVHGSVATNEVISYSDFDGLIIIKDQYVNSKLIEEFRKESMKIILKFDPLQHHGWFQIKESDLTNYPENYLPISALKKSKLVYPKKSQIKLQLKVEQDVDYKSHLIKILDQFKKREDENWKPNNIYQLKSMLSQIMLIPCLYYSAKYEEGIFKRESFDAVRTDFSKEDWMPIEIASDIRKKWTYNISYQQRLLLQQSNKYIRKIATRFFSPRIPGFFQKEMNSEFYKNLKLLVAKIEKEIK
ncbi:hypothetical protein [Winogradskyella sp.]|uniref:hypothetical protein n=1 Tax=Winogradskyella sp. TaxID=1883156 RepID=UPI003512E18A